MQTLGDGWRERVNTRRRGRKASAAFVFALCGWCAIAHAEPPSKTANLPTLARALDEAPSAAMVDLHYREILDPRRIQLGSRSQGNTSHGSLAQARRIDEMGPHHYVLAAHRGRPTRWSTDAMVEGVLRAAAAVDAQFPGVKTGIGNFSLETGGDISWSVSHNSGRDADIAFFFRDERGRHVAAPTLLTIGADGLSVRGRPWTLDVPASWAFVEALIRDTAMRVQWIFVSNPIRDRLLAYARSQGVDASVIAVAEQVLRQPGRAAPHDDHFHIRVHCTVRDRVEGCVEWGPRRSDLSYSVDRVRARTSELLRAISEGDARMSSAAFERIVAWEARESTDLLAQALVSLSPDYQARLVKALTPLGGPELLAAYGTLIRTSSDDSVAREAFAAVATYGASQRAPLLASIALDEAVVLTRRSMAVAALQSSIDSETLPVMVAGMGRIPNELMESYCVALRRFTLHRPDEGAQDDASRIASWRSWIAQQEHDHASMTWSERRLLWFDAAFSGAGFQIGDATSPNYVELIRAVAEGREELAWNADRRLMLATEIYLPGSSWAAAERARDWRRRAAPLIARSSSVSEGPAAATPRMD